jgi:hypothetical protein
METSTHLLCHSLIVIVIKTEGDVVGHVARMEKKHKILLGSPLGRRLLADRGD